MNYALNWSEREQRVRQRRIASFKRTERQKRLRQQLLAVKPFCCVCGAKLQGLDRNGERYANVVGGDRLACAGCVPVADAQRQIESGVDQ